MEPRPDDPMDLDPSAPTSTSASIQHSHSAQLHDSDSDSANTSPARKRQRTSATASASASASATASAGTNNNHHDNDHDQDQADLDSSTGTDTGTDTGTGTTTPVAQHSYANYQALLTDPIWFSGGTANDRPSSSSATQPGAADPTTGASASADDQQNMDSEFESLASSWWRPFPTEFRQPRAAFGALLHAMGQNANHEDDEDEDDTQQDIKENPEEVFIESFTLSSPTALPLPTLPAETQRTFRKSSYLADLLPSHRPLLLIRYTWPTQPAVHDRYAAYQPATTRKEVRLKLLPTANPATGHPWTMADVRKLTAKDFQSPEAQDVPAPEDLLATWHTELEAAWAEWSDRMQAKKKRAGDPSKGDDDQVQDHDDTMDVDKADTAPARPTPKTRPTAADAPAPPRVPLPPLPEGLQPVHPTVFDALPEAEAEQMRNLLRAEGYPEQYLWTQGKVPRDVREQLGMPLSDNEDDNHRQEDAMQVDEEPQGQVDDGDDGDDQGEEEQDNDDDDDDDDGQYDGGYSPSVPEDFLSYLIEKNTALIRTVPEAQPNHDRYGGGGHNDQRVDPATRFPMYWFPVRETAWIRDKAPEPKPAADGAAAAAAQPVVPKDDDDDHWPEGAISATCQLGVLVQFRLAKDAVYAGEMVEQEPDLDLLAAGEPEGDDAESGAPAIEFSGFHASRAGHPFVYSLAETPGTTGTTETTWRRTLTLATLVNPTLAPYVRVVLRPDADKLDTYPSNIEEALDDHYLAKDAQPKAKVHAYKYRAVCYLKTKDLNAAIRRGQPGVLTATRELMDMLKAMGRLVPKTQPEKFAFAVPEVAEREVDTIAPTPAGFQHDLYQYQQRSLAWLLRIENETGARTIEVMPKDAPNRNAEVEVGNYLSMDDVGKPRILRIGPGGVLYHLSRQEISDRDKWSPLLPVMKKMECRGAVEASKVGTGKTVVALALIMSRPFRSVTELPIPTWAPWEARQYLPSRATLVVARSDLTAQWRTEAMRFLPSTARVVMLTTMVDHKKISWNQMLLADLVIVSTAFLRNANYQKMVAALVGMPKYQYPLAQRRAALAATATDRDQRAFAFALGDFVESLRNKGRQVFGNTTGQCVVERVYWHRVIVDEAHEFCATTAGTQGPAGSGEAHVSTLTKDQIKQAQQARGFIEALRTRFMLGLTGSPPIDTPEKVADFAQLLQVNDLPTTRPAADAFLSAMSRSARPDLKLPPVLPRTIMVQMTPAELALAADAGRNVNARNMSDAESREMRLMALQHHQITDEMVHLGGEDVMSVDKLTDVLQARRSGDMQALQERDGMLQSQLQAQLRTLAHMVKKHVPLRQAAREALVGEDGFLAQLDEYLGAQVVAAAEQWAAHQAQVRQQQQQAAAGGAGGGSQGHSQSQQWAAMMEYTDVTAVGKKKLTKQEIQQLDQEVRMKAQSIRVFHQQQIVPNQQRLDEVTRQHNFMDSVITLISSGEEVECNICFESTLGPGAVGMVLRCGHMYCEPCVIRLQNHNGGYGQPLCPQCRHPIRDPIKMRWPIPEKKQEELDKEKEREAANADGLDYSKYGSKIKALVQYVNDTVRQDPTAKVLVFVQFRRLSDLISSAFSSLGVTNVRMAGGNVYVKRKALTAFKADPTVKVLFLSYQDCVSGLHLTEANHVLIVHPFLARDEQTAKAYEMQGIARAVRAGQTRPVHVVRFVCEHTLEQDIHNQRSTPLTAAELEALANQEQQQQAAAAAGGGANGASM